MVYEYKEKVKWTRLTWLRISMPRYNFISWMLMKQKILTRYTEITAQCQIYQVEDETQDHIFYQRAGAKEI